jgi:hypothetical protein
LLVVPSVKGVGEFLLLNMVDVAKVLMMPIVLGGTIAFFIGRIDAYDFARVVAFSLLVWGVIDVFDGTAGLKTGLDKDGRYVRNSLPAKQRSLIKTAFGIASCLVGGIGLLAMS